jgi:hypothetical protein
LISWSLGNIPVRCNRKKINKHNETQNHLSLFCLYNFAPYLKDTSSSAAAGSKQSGFKRLSELELQPSLKFCNAHEKTK